MFTPSVPASKLPVLKPQRAWAISEPSPAKVFRVSLEKQDEWALVEDQSTENDPVCMVQKCLTVYGFKKGSCRVGLLLPMARTLKRALPPMEPDTPKPSA